MILSSQSNRKILGEKQLNISLNHNSQKKGMFSDFDSLQFSTIEEQKKKGGNPLIYSYESNSSDLENSQAITTLESQDTQCGTFYQGNTSKHNSKKQKHNEQENMTKCPLDYHEKLQNLETKLQDNISSIKQVSQATNLVTECGKLEDKFTGQINKAFRLMYENLKEESEQIIAEKDEEIRRLQKALDKANEDNQTKQAALIELAECYCQLKMEVEQVSLTSKQVQNIDYEDESLLFPQRDQQEQYLWNDLPNQDYDGQQQQQYLQKSVQDIEISKLERYSQDIYSEHEERQPSKQTVEERKYETFSKDIIGEENYVSIGTPFSVNQLTSLSKCKMHEGSTPHKNFNDLNEIVQRHDTAFEKEKEEVKTLREKVKKASRMSLLSNLKKEIFSEGLKSVLFPSIKQSLKSKKSNKSENIKKNSKSKADLQIEIQNDNNSNAPLQIDQNEKFNLNS